MSLEVESLSSKIEKLEEMLDILDRNISGSSAVLNFPKASGVIETCQKKMLSIMKGLQEENIDFWLDGNSLLASCRTKVLLPWDTSIEIGMLEESWLTTLHSNSLRSKGIVVDGASFTEANYEPRYDSIKPSVKIRIWKFNNGLLSCGENEVSPEAIFPLSFRTLEEIEFPSPADPWQILKSEFGEGWMRKI